MSKSHHQLTVIVSVLCVAFLFLLSGGVVRAELVGSLEGEVKVDQGQMSWSLPMEMPEGVNGLSPEIGLGYSPGGGNGILGLGFHLGGQSAVTRCPASKEYDGVDGGLRFDAQSRYCLDGQRLISVGNGEYRTAVESFGRVVANSSTASGPASWTVYAKDGYIFEYGNSTDSQVVSQANNNAVIAWRLKQKRDRFGNAVNYEYAAATGAGITDLSRIRWATYQVDFLYQARPDTFTSWQYGNQKTLNQRLSSVVVSSNNQKLREYRLGYGQSGSGQFSRLSNIALCDAAGQCTKPTVLEWQASASESAVTQEVMADSTKEFASFVMGDVNQDGKEDLCYLKNGLYCRLNGGNAVMQQPTLWSGSVGAAAWHHPDSSSTLMLMDLNNDTFPDYCIQGSGSIQCGINNAGAGFISDGAWSTAFNRSQSVRFVDLNADRLPDICDVGAGSVECAYNTGNGFGVRFGLLGQGWPVKQGDVSNATVSFMDINSDGLVDLCGAAPNGYVCSLHTGFNAQNAPVYAPQSLYSNVFGSQWANKEFANSFRYGDLNADGLPDACWRSSSNYQCAINTGKGFTAAASWAGTTGWAEADTAHATLMLNDIDSDGRSDLCVAVPSYEWRCGLNNGTGFGALRAHAPLRYAENSFQLPDGTHIRPQASPLRLTDLNGDGDGDLCYRHHDGIACGLGSPMEHSLLVGINTAYGNSTKINYNFLSNPTLYAKDGTRNDGLLNLQPNRRVVQRVSTSNGVGGLNAVNYRYVGLAYDKVEGVRSFRQVIQTDEVSGKTTVAEYHQDKTLNGRVRKAWTSLNNVTLQLTENTWQSSDLGGGRKLILPKTTIEKQYDYASRQVISTQTSTYGSYDAYGNPLKVTVDSRTPDNSDWNTKTTTSTYWNDPTNWLLGKPVSVAVVHQNAQGSLTRTTNFTYYSNGAVQSEVLQPGNALALNSTFTYDRFGNKTQVSVSGQGLQTRTSRTEYDASGLYVTKQVNALGHAENITPDPRCGLPASQTGPNGLTTRWTYDSLCQKTKETRADGTVTVWQRAWSQGYSAGYGVTDHSVYSVTESSSGSAPKTVWYDGLGREVRSTTKGFNRTDGGDSNTPVQSRVYETILQDKVYDARGLLVKATLPYEEGKFPGDNSYWVSSEYDVLGRVIAQHKPTENGQPITTRYAYAGLSTTVTDPTGNSTVTTKNLADKPAKVVEGNGASTITYTYDALGNLLQTDTNGQVIQMGYDARGNKAWMKDPTMGNWQYQYNAYGELVWQRDGKGQTTTQEYDLLGRMTKRTTAEGVATWEYDTSANGKGKLAAERGINAETYYTYDKYGRPIATTRKIAGQTYTSQLGYDPYSRPAVEVYPDGVQVNRHYTDTGYLQRITLPKKYVWDYDYVELEKTLAALTKELVKLHDEAYRHEENYLKYIRQAERFILTADAWERSSAEAAAAARDLRAQANQLKSLANSHQATANHYRNLSSYYWNLLGNRYLDYVSSGNGYVNYHGQGACVSRNWKGDCTAYQQFNVSIPASIVPTVCNVNYGWKGASWCSWGPPRSLNIGQFYGERAQEYANLAASERAQAQAKDSTAAVYEQRAANYHNIAESYRQQAQQQYELARKETALLTKVMDKMEDYENASDEIERALHAHNNNGDEILLWAATGHDASGRIRGELTGNGLLTRHEYDPYSGRLNRITTGIEGSSTNPLIRDLHYSYDGADNVLSREDAIGGSRDNYQYDAFDRLTSAVRTTNSGKGGFSLSYGYDVYGNLTHKSDAGSLVYDPTNNRLQSLAKTNGTQKQYSYDANGNMLQAGDNVVKWTSYNQPLEIRNSKTNSTATFLYDANQQRVQQVNGTDGKSETTTYVSKAFEVTHNDNGVNDRVTQYKHQIYAGDEVVAIQIRTLKNGTEKTPDETRYLHKDALGNVDTLTDSHGTVIQRISYDPFGKRTVTSGIDPDLKAWTARGFTGHEHLDNLGLIHMNARLYDPEVGRFISPDTYIQSPGMSQSYNRYVYVKNNPLKYTDPSGHFWFLVAAVFFVAAVVTDIPILDTIATIAFAAALGPGASLFGAMLKGAAAGFISGLVSGTNPFKAALWGAISGGVSRFVGHGSASNIDLFANGKHVGSLIPNSPFGAMKWLAHGVSQGVITQLRGGNFKSGFVGAVVGDVSGRMSGAAMGTLGTSSTVFSRTMVAAVFGGLAAEATGGNFNDGAIAAAFSHLFNNEASFPTCTASMTGACVIPAGTVNRNTYGDRAGFTSSLTYGASRARGAYYGTEQAAQDCWNAVGITLGFVSLGAAGVYVVGVVGADVLLVTAAETTLVTSGRLSIGHAIVSGVPVIYSPPTNTPEDRWYAVSRLAIDATAFGVASRTASTLIGISTTTYDTGKYATEHINK